VVVIGKGCFFDPFAMDPMSKIVVNQTKPEKLGVESIGRLQMVTS
jgi:hypothetical protein